MIKEIEGIIFDVAKVKEKTYKNKSFINPSMEQQEIFFKIITSLAVQLEDFFIKNKDTAIVQKTNKIIDRLSFKYFDEEVCFDVFGMKEKTNKCFEENKSKNEGNFIAHVDYLVFHSIRVILEILYRLCVLKKHDKELDFYFIENKIEEV
jgi:hypothetical protein